MKEKLTPKKFMEFLQSAVDNNIITQEEKENIEIECAYIQYENSSKLESKMKSYMFTINENAKSKE